MKVLRVGLPIVESLSGLQESIFSLSRGPQLHFGEKSKNWSNFIKFTDFPPFPLFGVPWAAVILNLKDNSGLLVCPRAFPPQKPLLADSMPASAFFTI